MNKTINKNEEALTELLENGQIAEFEIKFANEVASFWLKKEGALSPQLLYEFDSERLIAELATQISSTNPDANRFRELCLAYKEELWFLVFCYCRINELSMTFRSRVTDIFKETDVNTLIDIAATYISAGGPDTRALILQKVFECNFAPDKNFAVLAFIKDALKKELYLDWKILAKGMSDIMFYLKKELKVADFPKLIDVMICVPERPLCEESTSDIEESIVGLLFNIKCNPSQILTPEITAKGREKYALRILGMFGDEALDTEILSELVQKHNEICAQIAAPVADKIQLIAEQSLYLFSRMHRVGRGDFASFKEFNYSPAKLLEYMNMLDFKPIRIETFKDNYAKIL